MTSDVGTSIGALPSFLRFTTSLGSRSVEGTVSAAPFHRVLSKSILAHPYFLSTAAAAVVTANRLL